MKHARVFGDYRVRIDNWEVDYGDQTPLVLRDAPTDQTIDHEVEVPEAGWMAIRPPADAVPEAGVVFVDGIRRLEARIQVRLDEKLVYGGFGSLAVGAAELSPGRAMFGELRAKRIVVLGAGQHLPAPVPVRPDLIYQPESTVSTELDAPLRHIQRAMRSAESELARDVSAPDRLLIVDGPLSFGPVRPGSALGFIKRIHEIYVPARFLPLIASLPAGARTPLFSIEAARSGFARYSWFQRLAAPGPGSTEMHGIVRLEALAAIGLEAARNLADMATSWLPRVIPSRARDPRSPQNLLPIGALEQRLRLEMGDARLFHRWIGDLVAREALYG